MTSLAQFLEDRLSAGGLSTEDTLGAFLPLLRETLEAHAAGQVAPLQGLAALHVDEGRIWFAESDRGPQRLNAARLEALATRSQAAFEVVSELRRTTEVGGRERSENLAIARDELEIARPAYLPGYVTWEHAVEHHDPLTDVLSLGLILATLACGLDLRHPGDLEQFVEHRDNLFTLQPTIHPVLAQTIVRMTELDRHRRVQDLAAVLAALENYRDQDVSFEMELLRSSSDAAARSVNREQLVLGKLRERLFEISRRNRLLHFQPTMSSVNLTQASIPLAFDVRQVRAEQLLVWNDELQGRVAAGGSLSLNKYLNFSEALYLPSVLERIASDTRRDEAEFGFAQLRLAICFLHWANLKADPVEVYDSPLVLLPVRLQKKKGIRDTYHLEIESAEAEVNPVLRHLFQQLYGIALPESLDLTQQSLGTFHQQLAERIEASAPGVSLELIDKPRIAIIHEKARRKLDQYRRRARLAGRGVRRYQELDYSYDPANYHPLGLTLFQTKVQPAATRLQAILEDRPRPRMFAAAAPPALVEKQRVLYQLESGQAENPYRWSFDLCNVTLANFRYRKMSLVRDYDSLLSYIPDSAPFEATFSLAPKAVPAGPAASRPLAERYDVVPCDPTQVAAIAEARTGRNFIIQGPPGTGKSQTITNLIADYVARGQRVLFVCEKRAAIDVVYARLRHCGLDALCCLIHDSQTDKRGFVLDLKQTYEKWLAQSASEPTEGSAREAMLAKIQQALQPLQQYAEAMAARPEIVGTDVRSLVRRGIVLAEDLPALDLQRQQRLPYYADWQAAAEALERFADRVHELQPDGILAHHPLHPLSPRLAASDDALEIVERWSSAALDALDRVRERLASAEVPQESWRTLSEARSLTRYARDIQGLAGAQQMRVLDAQSSAARELMQAANRLRVKRRAQQAAAEAAAGWHRSLPPAEVSAALDQAQRLSARKMPWLRPGWWRLRRVLHQHYDFKRHQVPPTWTQVLGWLDAHQQATAALDIEAAALRYRYQVEGDVDAFFELVRDLQAQQSGWSLPMRQIHDRLLTHGQPAALIAPLLEADRLLSELFDYLAQLMDDFEGCSLDQVQQQLAGVRASLAQLPDLLACLAELNTICPALRGVLQRMPLTVRQAEAALIRKTFDELVRQQRSWGRYSGAARERHVRQLERGVAQWRDANAVEIARRAALQFARHVARASLPASQLDEQEKDWKKRYTRGRRELEHEFGKSMRFKSIRDLVSGESGEVVRDLKPVWLMSPLSVSDTLPLGGSEFDVVIFDEASQITLEEAVPALFRARQTIVVGDEMQLPPTDFFSAKRSEEDESLLVPDEGQVVRYDLDSDSFLNQATRNLPGVMLGWHYRSRSESLISFSNWAFYGGRLLTVPEQCLAGCARTALQLTSVADGMTNVRATLERPISFHHLSFGVYDKRRNAVEAEYIAHLVAGLLAQPARPTIGIVAFSEAQQSQIDAALEQLAQQDSAFRARLSEEWEREEDGQFVGLLVKNLENIQGDERDVIILSICYGYNAQQRMLMNFGPINRNGGEKRLNVAFSRARKHMALVSSIRAGDITNVYNDGANCLKNYLHYAEAVSEGDLAAARGVLHGLALGSRRPASPPCPPEEPLVDQLGQRLAALGWIVERGVGQSHFRCDLAIRHPDEPAYRLGILVDNDAYYQQQDTLERELLRPRLLESFGWRIAFVLAKDWYHDPAAELQRIQGLLGQPVPTT